MRCPGSHDISHELPSQLILDVAKVAGILKGVQAVPNHPSLPRGWVKRVFQLRPSGACLLDPIVPSYERQCLHERLLTAAATLHEISVDRL